MLLADAVRQRGIDIDVERVLRMAICHDWAETRMGDLPKTATEYFGAEQRKHAETLAFADVVTTNSSAALYRDLYEDYEERRSLEARLVKAADIIDLLVEVLALERAGARGLEEFWEVAETADFQLEGEPAAIVKQTLASILLAREQLDRIR
jgi:putative hydrolase of HD superfamily